jgi:hypothetical protein
MGYRICQSINQSDENLKIPRPLVWAIILGLFLTLHPCLLYPNAAALNMVVVIEKTWQSSGLTLCQNKEKKILVVVVIITAIDFLKLLANGVI